MRAAVTLNSFTRFIVTAGILYSVLFLIYQFVVKQYTYYDQAFIAFIIKGANLLLTTLGYDTFMVLQDRDFQLLGVDGSRGVWIGSECNAIKLFALFAVFVIAYPGKLKHKLWFIPVGIIAIHILNVLRVAALAIIAKVNFYYLDFNHTYTFTFIVYGFIFLLWMIWVNRFSARQSTDEQIKA
jgi:exosortase family protein XrtF